MSELVSCLATSSPDRFRFRWQFSLRAILILMLGIGAVLGATVTIAAYFIAPFFGIALAVYMLVTGQKRELPYGPYLSAGTALAILVYYDVGKYLSDGAVGLMYVMGW